MHRGFVKLPCHIPCSVPSYHLVNEDDTIVIVRPLSSVHLGEKRGKTFVLVSFHYQ